MTHEGVQPTSSAPEYSAQSAVSRFIHEHENRLFGENAYPETFEYVLTTLTPLLDALSVPERYSRGTTLREGGKFDDDLWRRELDFAPVMEIAKGRGKEHYPIFFKQIVDKDGNTRYMSFETNVDADTETIASMRPDEGMPEFKMVFNSRGSAANREEIEDVKALAKFVAEQAPIQAVQRGEISEHWMERNASELPEGKHKEGFPPEDGYREHSTYDIITSDGQRATVNVEKQGDKTVWKEHRTGDTVYSEDQVAAWRRSSRTIPDPEYHTIRTVRD